MGWRKNMSGPPRGTPRASASRLKSTGWLLVASMCSSHAVQLRANSFTCYPVMEISTAGYKFLDGTWAFSTQERLFCWGWNCQGLVWSHFHQQELCHCQGWFSGRNLSPELHLLSHLSPTGTKGHWLCPSADSEQMPKPLFLVSQPTVATGGQLSSPEFLVGHSFFWGNVLLLHSSGF